jgi:hypothetical protein
MRETVRSLRAWFGFVAILNLGAFVYQAATVPFGLRVAGNAILTTFMVVSHFYVAVRMRTLLVNNVVFILSVVHARTVLIVLYEVVGVSVHDTSWLWASGNILVAILLNIYLVHSVKRLAAPINPMSSTPSFARS